jgi:hypothetical protein
MPRRSITLDASISGMKYSGHGGETTQRIVALTIGEYSVNISSLTVISVTQKKSLASQNVQNLLLVPF